MSLCIRCGEWKQVPLSRCGCGFCPAEGNVDEAKSYILTTQFRAAEGLEEIARRIKAGEAIRYEEAELRIASRLKRWILAVNLSFLAAAALLGLLFAFFAMWITGKRFDFPVGVIVITTLLFVIAAVAAFNLMGHRDRMTRRPDSS